MSMGPQMRRSMMRTFGPAAGCTGLAESALSATVSTRDRAARKPGASMSTQERSFLREHIVSWHGYSDVYIHLTVVWVYSEKLEARMCCIVADGVSVLAGANAYK
jgi:hypothetical protein